MFEAMLSRMAASPMFIAPDAQMQFVTGIKQLADGIKALTPDQQAEMNARASTDDDFWPEAGSWLTQYRPYKVEGGVLTIPVQGSLMNGFPYQFGSYATGYPYIQKAFERGLADPEVTGIVFDINSPGGEVSGNFDLVDYLSENRSVKPTLAMAADHAYSAAYNIAAAAEKVTVCRTGGVGSIGVVTMHMDMSEYFKKIGLGVTFVYAGKHKVDGNPYQPLSDSAKKRMQARIDGLYSIFVSSVARNRGMDEQAVRDTEALTYSADEGVETGLADAVMSSEDAMADFAGKLAPSNGAFQMSTEHGKAPAATSEANQQEGLEKARQEGFTAGKAKGLQEGASAERERIQGIMSCEEASERSAQATTLALKTNLSVDEAREVLASMPAEQTQAAAGNAFETAMDRTENPEIFGEAGGDEAGGEGSEVASILSAFHAASGEKPAAH